MKTEIVKQVQAIKKMIEVHNALKELEKTDAARAEIEVLIIKATRELVEKFDAEEFNKEEYENSFYKDLKVISTAYETIKILYYKWDEELAKKQMKIISAMEDLILAIVENIIEDENKA